MRLLVLTVLSVALMVVDARFETLKPLRSQLGLVLTPVYWLTDLPMRAACRAAATPAEVPP